MRPSSTASQRRTTPAPPPAGRAPRLALLTLMRPRQWVKNVLVLAPLVFAGLAREPGSVVRAVEAALLFTAASALAYVLNDMVDVERDRRHPRKRHARPLAAGWVSARQARVLLAVLGAAVAAGTALRPAVAPALAAFLALNLAYSLKLKHVAGLDALCVCAGYLLRVYAGAAALDVPLSGWMLATTFALSLFLVAGKRGAELAGSGAEARSALGGYSPRVLLWLAWGSAAGSLVAYAAYVLVVRPVLLPTIPLVAFGLGRYAWLAHARRAGESPEDALWNDLPLLAAVVLWAAACLFLVR